MPKHVRGTILTASIVALLMLPSSYLPAQSNTTNTQANTVDCSLDGVQHTCNRADFLRTVAEAHTLAFESDPKDRIADAQMASLAHALGKQIVPAQHPADMTLHLVRTPSDGVSVGPSDTELATLRVFDTKNAGSHLVWVESYRGQADMPWLAVVRALTQQLQATIAGH